MLWVLHHIQSLLTFASNFLICFFFSLIILAGKSYDGEEGREVEDNREERKLGNEVIKTHWFG